MEVRVGTAPNSWGVEFPSDPRQPPWTRFLDEVAQAGYEWIELGPYGYLPHRSGHSPTGVGQARPEGVQYIRHGGGVSVGSPADWPEVEEQVLGAGELVAALGAKFLVLIDGTYNDLSTGEALAADRLDGDSWKRLIDTTHRVADIARQRFDLDLVFHPHAETHVEYEDQIEAFLDETDPDRVSLCLDTGHHVYRGGDTVEFMRRHHERIPYLHLKSVDAGSAEEGRGRKHPVRQGHGHRHVLRALRKGLWTLPPSAMC